MAKAPVALAASSSMGKKHDYQDLQARSKLSELIGENQWKGQQVNKSGFEYGSEQGTPALENFLKNNMAAAMWTKWKALPTSVYDSYLYGFYRCCYESARTHGCFDDRLEVTAAKNKKARHDADKILEGDLAEPISSQEAQDMADARKAKLLPDSQYSFCASFSHDVPRYTSPCASPEV